MTAPFVVRTLQPGDAPALLAFELANRDWFERHVAPRAASFYSPRGIAGHVAAYLRGLENGTWHPHVIVTPAGAIVGRANLKDIDAANGSAEVGYRIAQDACGQGLATLAVTHLVGQARERWHLARLVAHVYADNAASRRVLERCGFLMQPVPQPAGARADCRFTLVL